MRKQAIQPKKNWTAENVHYVGDTGWWLKLAIKNKIDLKKNICCKERFYFLINGNSDDFRRIQNQNSWEKWGETKSFATSKMGDFFNWKITELRVTEKEHQIDVKLTH